MMSIKVPIVFPHRHEDEDSDLNPIGVGPPLAHADSHEGGSDPITPAGIGATTLAAVKADVDVASAISLKHAAVTVSAPILLSGQAISIVNNAVSPAAVTAVDIGVVDAASDVKIPTSKAVATAIAAMVAGGVPDGDKGDITVSGSGAAWAIDNNAVTLAKLAIQAAETILTNATSGAAVPTALALAEQTLAGRITGGHVVGLTPTQIRTLINVADGANVNANHSGDATGATALTIAAKAVTYAKIQDVSATDKLLGRVTAGAGAIEEIACTAAGRALLDDADAATQRTTLTLGSTNAPTFDHLVLTNGIKIGETSGLLGKVGFAILDDAVYSFTPVSTYAGLFCLACLYSNCSAIIAFRCSVSGVFANALAVGSLVNTTTGILTGTTGTDGKVTISAHTDGKIYIENRLGVTGNFSFTIIAGYGS